jgi:hypothetical protein
MKTTKNESTLWCYNDGKHALACRLNRACAYVGKVIVQVAALALEDANFHKEAADLMEYASKMPD